MRQFILWSVDRLGIHLCFKRQGVDEIVYFDSNNDSADISVANDAPVIKRTSEGETLLGAASKACKDLGWQPRKFVQEMCADMVVEDIGVARKHRFLPKLGYVLPGTIEN